MTTPPLPPTLAEAVLGHLGVTPGPPALTLLDALVAAYTRTVPWESATRIAKRAATADVAACPRWPQEFWTDAVQRGAGGTCFESNYAFFSLLRALGYDGYLTVNDMGNTVGCHTAIVVMLAGERWLVDVGLPLHTPLPLHPTLATSRRSPFHTYTVHPRGEGRYSVERDVHSQLYCFTLLDRPITDAAYRAATTADYGPAGLFLDRVIVTKVIDGRVWRFNSGEQPPHLQRFADGRRTDYPLAGDVAAAVAAHFALDEPTVRTALQSVGGPA